MSDFVLLFYVDEITYPCGYFDADLANRCVLNYNMTVWIWAGNYISFNIAAGLIRLHMPGVKKSRV